MDNSAEQGRARDALAEHESRQAFEHELIDRKTRWLITSQTILFAAYGVTFERPRQLAT